MIQPPSTPHIQSLEARSSEVSVASSSIGPHARRANARRTNLIVALSLPTARAAKPTLVKEGQTAPRGSSRRKPWRSLRAAWAGLAPGLRAGGAVDPVLRRVEQRRAGAFFDLPVEDVRRQRRRGVERHEALRVERGAIDAHRSDVALEVGEERFGDRRDQPCESSR